MKEEKLVYDNIENILRDDKNILERALCLKNFCEDLKGEKDKKKYLSYFFKSLNSCFGSLYIHDLFNDTGEDEKRKYIIFTDNEAEIAYFFTKCMNTKKAEKFSLILQNMEATALDILKRFEKISSNHTPIKNDVEKILDFLDKKYDLYRRIFKEESTTLSLLNYKDKFPEEEPFNKNVITYDIRKHYFLFYEKDIKRTLLNKIAYVICLALINKTRDIPEIIKEKLKSLGFEDFDIHSFEEQFKVLKELLIIGLSYDIPLEDNISLDIKKDYNFLLLSVINIL